MGEKIIHCTSCGTDHSSMEELSYKKSILGEGDTKIARCSQCGVSAGLTIMEVGTD